MKKNNLLNIIFSLLAFSAFCQENPVSKKQNHLTLQGYVSSIQSVMFDTIHKNWISDNTIHNRLNLSCTIDSSLKLSLQLRNRFIWGETVKYSTSYSDQIEKDNGYIDMSWNILNEKSFLLNTNIDRAYAQYSKGKFEITLGRQRINWGQTMAWNPNDIFNNFSFFDFDYIERPGSDALRVQYYRSSSSVIETAVKLNADKKITAAGLFRFNKWNYDIQFIGGLLNEEDIVTGGGWSGYIKSFSLRGEVSYIHPIKSITDTTGLILASVSSDYTFANNSVAMLEVLYGNFKKNNAINFMDVYSAPMSVKNISFTKYNILGQYTYPVSPLFNISLAAMYMPEINGVYSGPTFSYSLKDNLDISLIIQAFSGKFNDPVTATDTRKNFFLGFFRLKGCF